jgi:hypothetical protein
LVCDKADYCDQCAANRNFCAHCKLPLNMCPANNSLQPTQSICLGTPVVEAPVEGEGTKKVVGGHGC